MAKKWYKKLSQKRYVVPAVAIVGMFIIFVGYRIDTHNAIVVADEFRPDSSWGLESETIVGSAPICPKACPSVARAWKRSSAATREELASYMPKEWREKIKGDCTGGKLYVCSVTGSYKGYSYSVTQRSPDEHFSDYQVALLIQKL